MSALASLKATLEAAPDAVLVVDRNHRVVWANEVGRGLARQDHTAAESPACYEVLHGRHSPCRCDRQRCPVAQAFATQAAAHARCVCPTTDGGKRVLDVVASPLVEEDGDLEAVLLICREAARATSGEQETHHLRCVLLGLCELMQLATGAGPVQSLVERICEVLIRSGAYGSAWIALSDGSKQIAAAARAITGEERERAVEHLEMEPWPSCARRALGQDGVVILEPTAEACGECALLECHRGAVTMCARLERLGERHGVVVASLEKGLLPQEGQRHFAEVASGISCVLHTFWVEQRRRAAEAALRESEERVRAIFEAAKDSIFVKDRSLRYVQVNSAMAELFGVAREELIGKTDVELFGAEVAERLREVDSRVLAGETVDEETTKPVRGVPRTFHVVKAPLRNSSGEIVGLCGIARDITVRKEAEEALWKLTEQLESRIRERTAELEAANRRLLAEVAERRLKELALRQSEARLAEAQRIAHLGHWEYDIPTARVWWSEEVYRIFGVSPRDFGETYDAFIAYVHPDDRERVESSVRRALHQREPHEIEHRIVRPDGIVRTVVERGKVTCDAKGEPLRIIGTVQDITDQKHAEEALATRLRYEEQLSACSRSLLLGGPDALSEVLRHLLTAAESSRAYVFENFDDPELGLCARLAHEACAPGVRPHRDCSRWRRVRYAGGLERWRQVLSAGKPIVALAEELPQAERELLEAQDTLSILILPVVAGGTWQGFLGFDDTKHRRTWDEDDIRVLRAAGWMIGVYTERERAEEERVAYQRRLRSLASELVLAEERERRRIANALHETVAQNLSATKLKLQELRSSLPAAHRHVLDQAVATLDEAIEDLYSQVFALAPPYLYELGLEASLGWLVDHFADGCDATFELKDDGAEKPLSNDVRALLFQSVRELLRNAVKHAHPRRVEVRLRRLGQHVKVEVRDDGAGFDTAILTNCSRRAEGFGLFAIRERIAYLGGSVEVVSAPGHGTRVCLSVPLNPDRTEESTR